MTPSPAIRGRDAELRVLDERLATVASGTGAAIIVEGEPGLGKSLLVEHAVGRARALGLGAAAGAAEPGTADVPLAALRSAVRTPGNGSIADAEAALQHAALDGPLLVAIDDLQWADLGTLAALRTLPPRLDTLPIAWLVAHRPAVSPDAARTLDRLAERGAVRLVLGPLEPRAVAAVAADVLGAEPGPDVLALAARAAGHPYFLVELMRALRDEQRVRVAGGVAELLSAELPVRVRATMRERLDGLSPDARRTAAGAAALGRHFPYEQLAALLGTTAGATLGPVGELLDADLLAAAPDGRLGFRHDLLREAVREATDPEELRPLERRAVDVLLAQGSSPMEIATRLARSAAPGDREAAATLLNAARSMVLTDPATGAGLARGALALLGPGDPLRPPLAGTAALLLHHAGRGDEARAFVDAAVDEELTPEQEAELHLRIAGTLAVLPTERVAAGRRALALTGIGPLQRARHLSRLLMNLATNGWADDAAAVAGEAVAAVADVDDAGSELGLMCALAIVDHNAGRYVSGRGRFLVPRPPDDPENTQADLAAMIEGKLIALVETPAAGLATAEAGLRRSSARPEWWATPTWAQERALHQVAAGSLTDAAAALEAIHETPDPPPIRNALDAAARMALGLIGLAQDDAERVARTEAAAEAMLASEVPVLRRHAAWLLARAAAARDDLDGAIAALERLGEPLDAAVLPRFTNDPADPPRLLRIAAAAGRPDLAASALALAERRAALNPGVAATAAVADHARGLAGGDPQLLRRAAAGLARAGRAPARAEVLEDLGAALLAAGDREGAVGAYGEALGAFVRIAATADAARVRATLKGLGVRRRIAAQPRPEAGWAALTDAERTVAGLVAGGMTNREAAERLVISPHTVGTHLRHVFRKLAISSRAQLAEVVAGAPSGGPR